MPSWRRNQFAVVAASFVGFTGFTLVMPFLPLYIRQLGVTDVGEIALWTGLSLGVTPALTALCSPFWGRVADRFGHKLMVERALISFVVVMTAMAYVTRPWHLLGLRAALGLFAGYGALTLSMAARSVPRERMAQAIGTIQTAQRLGPALGPVIGGVLAPLVGLRNAFLVSAVFYALAFLVVLVMYHEPPSSNGRGEDRATRVTFGNILAFENFLLLMIVIFGLQLVDRSFGPVLPLYLREVGMPLSRVPFVSGIIFTAMAGAAAVGNQITSRLIARQPASAIIPGGALVAAGAAAVFGAGGPLPVLIGAAMIFGFGIGVATTCVYTTASGSVAHDARGAAFGYLTTAYLLGLAISPVAAGLLGAVSMRAVFLADAGGLAAVAYVVRRRMSPAG
jgi:MFS family permease